MIIPVMSAGGPEAVIIVPGQDMKKQVFALFVKGQAIV
jgi:hypothetical protein